MFVGMLYAKAVSNYFLQKVVDLVRNAEPLYVVQISGENKTNKRSLHSLELKKYGKQSI